MKKRKKGRSTCRQNAQLIVYTHGRLCASVDEFRFVLPTLIRCITVSFCVPFAPWLQLRSPLHYCTYVSATRGPQSTSFVCAYLAGDTVTAVSLNTRRRAGAVQAYIYISVRCRTSTSTPLSRTSGGDIGTRKRSATTAPYRGDVTRCATIRYRCKRRPLRPRLFV